MFIGEHASRTNFSHRQLGKRYNLMNSLVDFSEPCRGTFVPHYAYCHKAWGAFTVLEVLHKRWVDDLMATSFILFQILTGAVPNSLLHDSYLDSKSAKNGKALSSQGIVIRLEKSKNFTQILENKEFNQLKIMGK